MQIEEQVKLKPEEFDRNLLRQRIITSLLAQGYVKTDNGRFQLESNLSKDGLREANSVAVLHKRKVAAQTLKRREPSLISSIAHGREIEPSKLNPVVIQVMPGSREELLFRYAACHWSIPVSAGYGRRLRFVVIDAFNEKLIGIFGLGDPVYSMGARDSAIGWTPEIKKSRLFHVLEAYVMGAVPPYSQLLCGKLIAMMALSNEVRLAFREKYSGLESLISKQSRPADLALLTTASALGRSSVYNRLRANGEIFWSPMGYTRGAGEFHFTNGIYSEMQRFVAATCTPTAKHSTWGNGFRNRREVVRKCLMELDLPRSLVYHGIKREIFLAPLASNTNSFLRGDAETLECYDRPATSLADVFRDRWLIRRAASRPEYKLFDRNSIQLFQ